MPTLPTLRRCPIAGVPGRLRGPTMSLLVPSSACRGGGTRGLANILTRRSISASSLVPSPSATRGLQLHQQLLAASTKTGRARSTTLPRLMTGAHTASRMSAGVGARVGMVVRGGGATAMARGRGYASLVRGIKTAPRIQPPIDAKHTVTRSLSRSGSTSTVPGSAIACERVIVCSAIVVTSSPYK